MKNNLKKLYPRLNIIIAAIVVSACGPDDDFGKYTDEFYAPAKKIKETAALNHNVYNINDYKTSLAEIKNTFTCDFGTFKVCNYTIDIRNNIPADSIDFAKTFVPMTEIVAKPNVHINWNGFKATPRTSTNNVITPTLYFMSGNPPISDTYLVTNPIDSIIMRPFAILNVKQQ